MGIGMLLEDFQVGVVLYAEKEGRSQFSKHYIYALLLFSAREINQNHEEQRKGKRKRKEREKENLQAPCDKMHRWIWAWLLSREFR